MKLLLDFHYSDFWADPGKQAMPQDWKGLTGGALCNAVQKFTTDTIKQFDKAGAKPDMVQIGNELNNGFMWPEGKIWGSGEKSVGGMNGFINLLKAANIHDWQHNRRRRAFPLRRKQQKRSFRILQGCAKNAVAIHITGSRNIYLGHGTGRKARNDAGIILRHLAAIMLAVCALCLMGCADEDGMHNNDSPTAYVTFKFTNMEAGVSVDYIQ